MRKTTFQRWLRSVPTLTLAQKHDLKSAIEQADRKNVVKEVESLVGVPTDCPHCGDSHIQSWGNAHGLPRYRCHGCRRTFNALTNTPLAGLHHKDRWLFYMEGMNEGESIRKAAWRCGINKKAAFNWRHRFLTLPEVVMDRPGDRDRRSGRDLLPVVFQGPAASSETAAETGRTGCKTGALPGTGSSPGSSGPVGCHGGSDSPGGQPSGHRSRAWTTSGQRRDPLHRRRRKRTDRPGGQGTGPRPPGG